MATTDLGKVTIVEKGTHVSTTLYEILDVVQKDGSSYICIKNTISGILVSNTLYWIFLTKGALQLWIEDGNTGTSSDFIAWLQEPANTAAATVTNAVLEAGYLGGIAYNAAAPTPARSGFYEFTSAGSCTWITGGAVTVKVGDRVSVAFTSPSTYVYKAIIVDLTNQDLYNVTVKVPLSAGSYYTLATAIAAIQTANKKKGLVITFEISSGIWETWKFNGADTSSWSTVANWEKSSGYNFFNSGIANSIVRELYIFGTGAVNYSYWKLRIAKDSSLLLYGSTDNVNYTMINQSGYTTAGFVMGASQAIYHIGFAIVLNKDNVLTGDNYYTGVIDTRAKNLSYSPYISSLFSNGISLRKDVNNIIRELYLVGTNPALTYYIYSITQGTGYDQIIIKDSNDVMVANIWDTTQTSGILAITDIGQGVTGFIIKKIPTSLNIITDTPIDLTKATTLDWNATIKNYLTSGNITITLDNTQYTETGFWDWSHVFHTNPLYNHTRLRTVPLILQCLNPTGAGSWGGVIFFNISGVPISHVILATNMTLQTVTIPSNAIYYCVQGVSDIVYSLKLKIIEQRTVNNYIADAHEGIVKFNNIRVDINGHGDFISLVDAINSIVNSGKDNIYNILIYPGTYDIIAELGGNTYIATASVDVIGVRLPDYVNLIGVGDRTTVILKGEIADADITTNGCQYISTLNLSMNNNLENLAITAKNLRYAIHDESGGSCMNWERNIKNCLIEHYGNLSGYWPSPTAYGSGLSSGCIFKAHNTIFRSAQSLGFSAHTNPNTVKAILVEMSNCEYYGLKSDDDLFGWGLKVSTNSTGTEMNTLILNNNIISGLAVLEEIAGSGNRWRVIGSGNTPCPIKLVNTVGPVADVILSNEVKAVLNNTGSTILKGKPCGVLSKKLYVIPNDTESYLFEGIALNDIPTGTFGYIKSKGFIPYEFVGITTVAEKSKIGIDSSGNIVVVTTGDFIGIANSSLAGTTIQGRGFYLK